MVYKDPLREEQRKIHELETARMPEPQEEDFVLPPAPPPPALESVPVKTPMVSESRVLKTTYPAGGSSPLSHDPAMPHTSQRHRWEPHEIIDATSQDDSKRNYTLEIWRNGPPMYRGQRMRRGMVEKVPVMSWIELEQMIEDEHGGGDYKVILRDATGKQITTILKNIDVNEVPPRVSRDPMRPGAIERAPFGLEPESDVALKARQDEIAAKAEISKIEAEARLKATKRAIKKEEEAEQEAEEAKHMRPEIAEIKRDMERSSEQVNRAVTELAHTMKDIVAKVAEPKKDDGELKLVVQQMNESNKNSMNQFQESMKMMMNMMIESNKSIMTVMTEQIKASATASQAPKDNSAVEAMKMVVEATRASAEKSEKLLSTVLAAQLAKPEDKQNAFMDAMKLSQQLQQQAIDMVEQRREAETPLMGEEGFNVPKIINGIAAAAERFLKPPQQPPQLPQPVQRALPTPSPLEQRLGNGHRPVQRNPAPVQRPLQTPPPVPQEMLTATPAPAIDPMMDDITDQFMQQMTQPQQEPAALPQQETTPGTEIAPEPAASASASQAAPAIEDADTQEHLRLYVSEAMRLAITDMKADPAEYSWPDVALAKWNKSFLARLAGITGEDADTQRLGMIKAYCDPATWAQCEQLFFSKWTGFAKSLNELMSEFAQQAALAA